jgi:hypothetical protein
MKVMTGMAASFLYRLLEGCTQERRQIARL